MSEGQAPNRGVSFLKTIRKKDIEKDREEIEKKRQQVREKETHRFRDISIYRNRRRESE